MAASTTYSTTFTAEGTKYPIPALYGARTVTVQETIDVSVNMDEANDIYLMIPLPRSGGTLLGVSAMVPTGSTAIDSGTSSELDLVLVDDNGTTLLADASQTATTFGTAGIPLTVPLNQAFIGEDTTYIGVGIRSTGVTGLQDGVVCLSATYEEA